MIIGRFLGWLLLAAALAAVGHDMARWWAEGAFVAASVGQLWAQVHQNSLLLLQPAVQRHIFAFYPEIWDVVFIPVLSWPAWLVLGVPGLLLLVLCRRRRRRSSFL